jgi:2-phosphoglycerate kinase
MERKAASMERADLDDQKDNRVLGVPRPASSTRKALQEQLQHVYWIGGGSGAGKSTIARRIAAQHGLRVYATDDVMADHARRSSPEDCPLLHTFMTMDMDERWVNRPPKTMLETFHWFRGEGFNLIIEDFLRLPREPGVIVEGLRLLPQLVKPLLSVPSRAVWLLPTPDFRQAVVESRGGSAWGFLAKTTYPERALRNLLERDRMFTDMLREETARLGLPAIEVDTTTTEGDLAKRVTDLFGL